MKINRRCLLLICILFCNCIIARGKNNIPDSLHKKLINILRKNLHTQQGWAKVHAAEFLLSLGYSKDIKSVFETEEELHGNDKQYRIGIWRVLFKATKRQKEKKYWEEKILRAYMNRSGKDRIHAAETLAKLRVRVDKRAPEITKQILNGDNEILKAYVYWSMSLPNKYNQNCGKLAKLFELLKTKNKKVRGITAYALRHHNKISKSDWDKLSQITLLGYKKSMVVQINLLSTAVVTAPILKVETTRFSKIKAKLLKIGFSHSVRASFTLCEALARSGNKQNIPLLLKLIGKPGQARNSVINDGEKSKNYSYNADVESAAAYAILRITYRYTQ